MDEGLDEMPGPCRVASGMGVKRGACTGPAGPVPGSGANPGIEETLPEGYDPPFAAGDVQRSQKRQR